MESTRLLFPSLILAWSVAGGDARKPDVVELANGTKVEGRVVYQDSATVVVRSGSRDREIAAKDVATVRSRAASLRQILDRWNALDASDVKRVLDLSGECRQADLTGEADVFAWKALLLDPENEAAHLALGHKPQSGGWLVREGAKSSASDKLDAFHADWGEAWRFATTHYALRTNLPLRQTLDVALDLEGFYRAFFDVFASDLRLYEVVEPMGAQVHADQQSFPEVASGRTAWFDPAGNILQVNASSGLARGTLFHEATHELLHATAERTKSARGDIPGWLDEGLAEYMTWGMSGRAGRAVFTAGALAEHHFRTHANAKQPYDLGRVLTFGAGDFLASSKADLKYAQAYTLVHFCLHGDGGKHRAGFIDFVRGAYLGQASMTDFKTALGVRGRDFEAAWLAHARQNAQ